MKNKYQTDHNLLQELNQDTKRIEKEYASKQTKKRQKRIEKEELSQRWVAPLLLFITLFIGWLVTIFFHKK